jgi:transcriptional regulator NrdR family protein
MSQLAVDVVKRNGKRAPERFDHNKLRRSIHAACLSVRSPEGQAAETAQKVCDAVLIWCTDKPEITSADIRHQASRTLKRFHPDAAYIYQHHKVIM